jgi:hypothetical protein
MEWYLYIQTRILKHAMGALFAGIEYTPYKDFAMKNVKKLSFRWEEIIIKVT